MFTIENQAFGKGKKIEVRNSAGYGMEILPDHGASLNALYFPDFHRERFINVIDGFTDPSEASTSGSFKGAILFPFPNRTRDGFWKWDNKKYAFPINEPIRNNALHGLLYNRSFAVSETYCSDEMAVVSLQYSSDGSDPGFPFLYKVDVNYVLTDADGLTVKTTISNQDQKSFPYGLGWHPYFKTGSKIDRLKLRLPHCHLLEADDRLLPTGQKTDFTVFQNGDLLAETVFDTAFELRTDKKIWIELNDATRYFRLRMHFTSSEGGYRFLQIYTSPHRQSIAIEPMTMPVNALQTQGDGLLVLEPKAVNEHTFHLGF